LQAHLQPKRMDKKDWVKGIGYIVLCCVIGYLLGVTKTVIFDSTPDGQYAYIRQCDSDDADGGCLHYSDSEKVSLKKAANIEGQRWGKFMGGLSLFLAFGIIALVENKNSKKRKL